MDAQQMLNDAVTAREISRAVAQAFKEAFEELGGTAWLVSSAKANPREFLQAMVKFIPSMPADPPPALQKSAVVIDLPWVRQGRLSYKDEIEPSEEYQR